MSKKILKLILIFTVMLISLLSININKSYAYVTTAQNLIMDDPEYLEKSNCFLKEIVINGYTLSPTFNKNTVEYYIFLPEDVTSVDVTATPEIEDAKVRITGNSYLTSNENTIKIYVTSRNGKQKLYSIYANRLISNGLNLSELSVEGYTLSPEFNSETYYYEIVTSKRKVNHLNITAISNSSNASIEVIGNGETLEDDNNYITILLRDGSTTTTYQINVKNQNEVKTEYVTKDDDRSFGQKTADTFKTMKESLKEKWDKYSLLAKEYLEIEDNLFNVLLLVSMVLALFVVIMVIKILRRNIKQKKRRDEDD